MKHHLLRRLNDLRKTHFKADLAKIVILLIIILALSFVLWTPTHDLYNKLKTDKAALKADIQGYDELAPAVFVVLVIIHLFLVVPGAGTLMGIVSGFVFGVAMGVVYYLVGLILGALIAFYLGRRFGRPFVEDIFQKEAVKKFDNKSEKQIFIMLLFIFLLPFSPDTVACFAAGVTKIKARYLAIAVVLGRLPTVIALNMIGAGLLSHELSKRSFLIAGIVILAIALIYWQRKRLQLAAYNLIKARRKKHGKA